MITFQYALYLEIKPLFHYIAWKYFFVKMEQNYPLYFEGKYWVNTSSFEYRI